MLGPQNKPTQHVISPRGAQTRRVLATLDQLQQVLLPLSPCDLLVVRPEQAPRPSYRLASSQPPRLFTAASPRYSFGLHVQAHRHYDLTSDFPCKLSARASLSKSPQLRTFPASRLLVLLSTRLTRVENLLLCLYAFDSPSLLPWPAHICRKDTLARTIPATQSTEFA